MSESFGPDAGQGAAIGYLRGLLLRGDLPYRAKWTRHSRQTSGGRINALAVARFLAEEQHMWGASGSARQAKDTVSRALSADVSGQLLTPETLTRFIEGFTFTSQEAHHLRALLAGVDPDLTMPITGESSEHWESGDTEARASSQSYRTVSLHELHYVGPNGLPDHHSTIQVIRAEVDGFDQYAYRFDTDHAVVAVRRGGRPVEGRWMDETLYEVVIRLSRPLKRGELTVIQYDTHFRYDLANPPPREFRRAARRRTDNLDMYLQFHRTRPPRSVWWARWADYREGADILDQERVPLDSNLSVWRYLPYIERTVVGFYWDF